MTDIYFNEQVLFNGHLSANAIDAEYLCTGPNDSATALDWLTAPLQMAPDVAFPSWSPRQNALGLSGINGRESVWAADPSAASPSDQIDTPFFSTSFLHPLPCSDSVVHFCQPPTRHRDHPSVCEDAALFGAGEDLAPHSFQPLTPPECQPAPAPVSKRVGASRLLFQSTPPSPPRYMPYPIGPDSTPRRTFPVSVHPCQWFDGDGPCGTAITGTKNAIGKHLETAHAIRLKADKTSQVCWWEGCRKAMRKESIARHILAVHMRDKVPCPSCGTRLARPDSLQRHQRTQCRAKGDAGK